MSKKHTKKAAPADVDPAETASEVDPNTPWVPMPNPAGGFMYFDQAGRVYKGFKTEETAQAAIDAHVPIENDPTLDES